MYEKQTGILNSRRRTWNENKVAICVAVAVTLAVGIGIWVLWLSKAADFEYRLNTLVILEGQNVYPEDFLYPSAHMERVSASFRSHTSRPVVGHNRIPLVLTRGLRRVVTTADLIVLAPADYVQIEFSDEGQDIEPADFLRNSSIANGVPFEVRFITETLRPEEYPAGRFPVQLSLNGETFHSVLDVVDTIPPEATPVDMTIPMGEEIFPADFVTDIYDVSPIASISFAAEPDIYSAGSQTVEIVVEDAFGNRGFFEAQLYVLPNEVPPVIEGARTIDSMVGNTIMYRRGVEAFDAFGRPLGFSVDSSGVNQHVIGRYTATYWTEDHCGLSTEVEIIVNVVSIDPAWVDERVDNILAEILLEDMTQVEQARAIFEWVRANVYYTGTISRSFVYEGAFQALQNRRGNCFVRYAISEVMLTRAGIPNQRIVRIPSALTPHNWNLINPDDLGWYHFDTSPAPVYVNRFMFTSSQAARYTRQIVEASGQRDFYTFNPLLYPEITQ